LTISLHILKQRAEFLAVAAKGRRCATAGLIMQCMPAAHDQLRLGLTASRKVGNAVVRNRARRRLRALAREVMPMHASHGHDYVLIAKTDTARRDYDALRQDMMRALQKLNVWRA
jgi:ribonuclease P protein component